MRLIARLRESVAASATPAVQRPGQKADPDADEGDKKPAAATREADVEDVVDGSATAAGEGGVTTPDSDVAQGADTADAEADGTDTLDTDESEKTDPDTPEAEADNTIECPLCKSDGTWNGKVCPACNGERNIALDQLPNATSPITESDSGMVKLTGDAVTKLSEATATKSGDGYRVTVIKEGLGNPTQRNYYTADSLREAVQSRRFEGLRAYANHPTPTEEREQPERDVTKLVGHYKNATYREVAGRAQVDADFIPIQGDDYRWVTDLIDSAIAAKGTGPEPLVGISVDGAGVYEPGQFREGMFGKGQPGQRVRLIREMTHLPSADLVTRPGAGGEFISRLRESLRHVDAPSRPDPDPEGGAHMKPAELQEKIKAATAKLRESLSGLRDAESDEAVATSLTSANEAHDELADLAGQEVKPEVEVREVEKPVAADENSEVDKLTVRLREVEGERDEWKTKAEDGEKQLSQHDRALLAATVIRETKVPEHLVTVADLTDLPDKDAMTAHVEREVKKADAIIARFTEALPVAGSPPRVPVAAVSSGKSIGADIGLPEEDLRSSDDA